MKKILFATTALVATAGIASAQDLGVALSGNAEMGIFGGTNVEDQFHTDIDVTFTMSGEADNGLTFGANIDLDESDGSGSASGSCVTRTAGVDLNGGGVIGIGDDYSLCTPGAFSVTGGSPAFSPATQGGEAIFVSFGGATLTMGDTDGAYDKRLAEMGGPAGSLGDDETSHAGFDSQGYADGAFDGQVARFDYTYDAFTGSVSVEMDDTGVAEPVYQLGVSYDATLSGVKLGVGLAYWTQEVIGNQIGVSVTAALDNGVSGGLTALRFEPDGGGAETTHFGIGLGYEMNQIAVGVNYGKFETGGFESSGVGLAASYDLGGGLQAQLGYGNSSVDGFDDVDTYSLGLRMDF